MAQLFSNNATATLATSVTNVATTITLTTGHGARFNAPTGGDYELLTLTDGVNVEIVKVTARSTDTLTVTRAQEGTTGRTWASSNTTVYAGITKGTLGNFYQGTVSIPADASALNSSGNARGTNAVNLQSGRTNVANVASGNTSVAVGYDSKAANTGSVAVGNATVAAGDYAVVIGNAARASAPPTWTANTAYIYGDVVKRTSGDDTFLCVIDGTSGSSEPTWVTTATNSTTTDGGVTWTYLNAYPQYGSAVSIGNSAIAKEKAVAVGNSAFGDALGVAIGDNASAAFGSVGVGQSAMCRGASCVAIGDSAYTDGGADVYGAVAIGVGAWVYGNNGSSAFGAGAVNRISNSWNVSGANVIRKDNAEGATEAVWAYCGVQTVYFSAEIDLKTLADDCATITIPTLATFYPDEIGIVITAATSVTGNPNISFGVTGNTTSLLASTTVTAVAAKNRTVFTPLSKNGVNSLTASVKTAATGTTLLGRFYWVGMLVEDE